MAEKKRKQVGIPFKELPVYCKIIRIVTSVLLCLGAIQTLIGGILMIENPYLWGVTIGALGFLIPALVLAIIEMNLEKKILARREAEGQTQPQQVEEKKAESAEAPKAEAKETWICPNCGAEVSGKFCNKCGTKRPEQVQPEPKKEEPKPVAEKEATPVVEEPVKEAAPAIAEVEENTGKKELFPKFLKWLIPVAVFGILTLLFFIGGVVNFVKAVSSMVDYISRTSADDFNFVWVFGDIRELFPYLVVSLFAAALVIIALIRMKKPNGLVKLNVIFPLGLFLVEFFYIITLFIYIALLNNSYGGEVTFSPSSYAIALFVLSIIGMPLCIATFILGLKPAGLVFKIANAATFGWLFIVCLVTATNSGRDFLFNKDGLVFVIFTMLLSLVLAAYPFFINVEPAAKKAK